MGFLVCYGKNGINSFSGTQYVNPTEGNKRLCLRTGTNPTDIVKYGLTTNNSASSYCGMRMKINNKVAYIGRNEIPYQSRTTSSVITSKLMSNGTRYYGVVTSTIGYSKTKERTASTSRSTLSSGTSSSISSIYGHISATDSYSYIRESYVLSHITATTLKGLKNIKESYSSYHATWEQQTHSIIVDQSVSVPKSENNFNI